MLISPPTHLSGSLFPHFHGATRPKYESNFCKTCTPNKNFATFTSFLANLLKMHLKHFKTWLNFPYFLSVVFRSGAYFFPIFKNAYSPRGCRLPEYTPLVNLLIIHSFLHTVTEILRILLVIKI